MRIHQSLPVVALLVWLATGCGSRVAEGPPPLDPAAPPSTTDAAPRFEVPAMPERLPLPAEPPEVLDASVDELLAAAETALGIAGDRYESGDTTGCETALSEARSYLGEAQSRLAEDPSTYPLLQAGYEKLLASLREGLEPSEVAEDVLAATPAELADTRAEDFPNGASYELPVDHDNPLVQKYLALFQKGARRRYIQESFNRAGRYRDMVLAEIRARNLPEELWVVPIIESGYKTSAYSRKRAVGIWQFMSSTARQYGLKVNEWIDERRDPAKSTRAALDYLAYLYEWFNNWDFALASYNRGEYGIQRDIKNSGIVDFMKMAELGATHRETQNHVPQIHAAAIIAKHPEKYGFTFDYHEPEPVDTVTIDYVVDLEVVAKCTGTTEDAIKTLNPELRTWVTPLLSATYPTFALKLPPGTRERYQTEIAQVADKTPKRQIMYVVRRGDTLGAIGRRFAVSWGKIKRWNNLRSSRIYPGQKLLIFPAGRGGSHASSSGAASATQRVAKTVSEDGQTYQVYTVRRGDTLTHIGRSFGVSVADLKRWNGVGSRIVPGQRLKVYTGGGALALAGDGSGRSITYVVRKGDSLWSIARAHRTTVSNLRRWNSLGRFLHPGQKLTIHGQ